MAEKDADETGTLRASMAELVVREQMSSIVIHEMAHGLQGLLTDAEVFASELESAKPRLERLRRDSRDLLEKVEFLVATLNNLRDRETFRPPEVFDVDETIREVLALLSSRASQRALLIEYRNEIEGRALVKASRALVRQVVFNLIDNAVRHSFHGREGRERVVRVTLSRRRGDLQFEVQNFGSPISRGELSRIFEPGFTTKASGMGFGLAIAKRLVEATEGTVELVSTETSENQAVFKVAASFPQASGEPTSERAPSGSSRR